MKSKLPQYVVNCLIAAGFDTLKVISYMDVSSNVGNSIEEVEDFIAKEHPDWLPNGKFSPGHRLRIQLFVQEVQKSFTAKVTLGKNKSVCRRSDVKGKKPKTDPKQSDSQASMFASARRQIAKWQKQQTDDMRELTEEKHFEVRVDLGYNDECIPIVVCLLCNHKCVLGSKNGSVLISNWTRHVSKCVKHIGLKQHQKISRFMVSGISNCYEFKVQNTSV